MANDVMIDMETLDTSPNCVILTIGAVRFDPKGSGVVERLELRPTIEEQTEIYNRSINEDTLRWWSEQSPEALEEAMGEEDKTLYTLGMRRVIDMLREENHKPLSENDYRDFKRPFEVERKTDE